MTLNDAALVVGANAIRTAITHFQAHTAAPNAAGTTNLTTAARVAPSSSATDADGDITWTTIAFTGGAANGPCTHITGWSASTGGTIYGTWPLSGDLSFNAAGALTVNSVTENGTAT